VTTHSLPLSWRTAAQRNAEDIKEIQIQLGHRSPMVTLSIYTHLFEDAFDSVMDRLDTDHREVVRPNSGPNVVELPEQRPSQVSD
jgi:site-specific recombinase XerC